MTMGLINRARRFFTELPFTEVTVNGAGGAGTWVDKNISATVGTAPCYVEVVIRSAAGGALTGVRADGSAIARVSAAWGTDSYTSMVYSAAGIIEAYQNVAGVNYSVFLTGYWR